MIIVVFVTYRVVPVGLTVSLFSLSTEMYGLTQKLHVYSLISSVKMIKTTIVVSGTCDLECLNLILSDSRQKRDCANMVANSFIGTGDSCIEKFSQIMPKFRQNTSILMKRKVRIFYHVFDPVGSASELTNQQHYVFGSSDRK